MATTNTETGNLTAVSCRNTDNPFWQLSMFPFRVAETTQFDLEDALSFFDYETATELEVCPSEPSPDLSVSLMPSVATSGDVCAVCMEEFADGTCGKQMPCSHVYHESCITLWLAEDGSCPLCRCRISAGMMTGQ